MDSEEAKEKYKSKTCPLMSSSVGGKTDCVRDNCAWWYDDTEYGGGVGCSVRVLTVSLEEIAFRGVPEIIEEMGGSPEEEEPEEEIADLNGDIDSIID